MGGLGATLDELLAALERAGSPVPALLAPGLDAGEVKRLAAALPSGLPDELAALYRWRNGLLGEGSPGEELLPGGFWLSLERSLALRDEQLEIAASATAGTGVDPGVVWRPDWLPLLVDFAPAAYVVVCDGTEHAAVWLVAGDDPDDRRLAYDGVGTLVATLAACWAQGAYVASPGGVEADEAAALAIWRRHNPVASAQQPGAEPPDLTRVLAAGGDPLARADAVRRAAARGDAVPLDAFLRALRDPDDGVRAGAAIALLRRKDPGAAGALIAALADPSPAVRSRALGALGALRHKPAVAAMVQALRDPELPVRIEAARALVAIPDRSAVPALVEALSDSFADVRQLAAGALARIRDPAARAAVAELVDDDDPVVRAIVERAPRKRRG